MTARDELAVVLHGAHWPDGTTDGFPSMTVCKMLAVAILAAGWRPPARQITTAAELEALPMGVVIRSSQGSIACRFDGNRGLVFGDERPFRWGDLGLPATVLLEGGGPDAA